MALHLLYYLSWMVTLLIGLVTLVVVKHYLHAHSLPPGPFSLPIIGNLLALRGKDVLFQNVLRNLGKKFNNLYTFWLGSAPSIIVTGWDLSKEALITRKNDFSGRVIRQSGEVLVAHGTGVLTSDFGPCWETLRKIMVSAVRYEMDDPEFVALRKSSEEMQEEALKGLPSDAIPMLSFFYRKRLEKLKQLFNKYHGFIRDKYFEHKRTYQQGVVRDFTDALLLAKEEAEKESKECKEHLTDKNLSMVLMDYFAAGTDTSKTTVLWILLIICNRPEIQKKMQAEIDENIGSRSPTQEDKRSCPFTQAVIFETLRYRPVVDFTMEHKTTCNTQLGGYKIPEGTACLFHILNCQRSESLWEDPEEFKPERFLDFDGMIDQKNFEGFMPFGIGPRSCAGEKLALTNVFLIVTRLLQNATLELENGPGSMDLSPEPKNIMAGPRKFYLVVNRRSSN